jgi:uncharacterized membrane protein SirB2
MRALSLAMGFLAILLVSTASAHGGETTDEAEEQGVSVGQITVISLVGAIAMTQLTSSMFTIQAVGFKPVMVGLAAYSGFVHLLLGLEDALLLLGGVGVMGFLGLLVFTNQPAPRQRLIEMALGGVIAIMFVGYFLSGDDLHIITEDRLGLSTKLAELALMALLIQKIRQPAAS